MYAVYILLCKDGSYYTGLSNDMDTRIWEHQTGVFPNCYTFKRRPVKLVWETRVATSEEANKLEKQIKGWSRKKKEALINGNIDELKRLSNFKKEIPLVPLRQAQGQVDFLIIGQGISGTFLSYYLQKQEKSFLVIDNNFKDAPSRIAAGIINPVSGRRLVTVWMADEIIPFAWSAYKEIGEQLDINAISQKNIIDFFPNPFMREGYKKKIEEGDPYVSLHHEEQIFNSVFNYEFGCGKISPAYTAHLETLLPAWRKHLEQNNQLLEEDFDLSFLQVTNESVTYKDISAGKIIFCDGPSCINNPWFSRLPFAPNKGEALVVEIPGMPAENIYKRTLSLVPMLQKDIFWVGSAYHWDFDNTDPTPAYRKEAEDLLKSWLKLPYKVLEHRSGLRPATLERRPFAGLHPLHPNVGILNGMGTKGCSLAPFFASQLTGQLLHGTALTAEADVKRFTKTLSK